MMYNTIHSLQPARLLASVFASTESTQGASAERVAKDGPGGRKLLADNSTTSVNGDDLHPIFNQNNTVLTVNGLNNHPLLTGFNDTLTVSGDGGTVNVTGDNNAIIIKGFHITTYDAGNNNSVSAQGVSDPVVKVPAPPRPVPDAPVVPAPAPAPCFAPVPAPVMAPQPGRRLLALPNFSALSTDLINDVPHNAAGSTDPTVLGAAVGGFALLSMLAVYVARRFMAGPDKSDSKRSI